MSNILNKPISLSLNAHWRPVNIRTIADAITDLCSSYTMGDNSCYALDMEFDLLENGEYDFDNAKSIRPVAWDEWVTLKVRDDIDIPIHSPKMTIRSPLITVARLFTDMPKKLFRKTPNKEVH